MHLRRMPTALKTLSFALIFATGLPRIVSAETIYFLVAEPLGRVVRNDSYVLPLSKEEDINHARYLISRYRLGYSVGDQTIVVANVVAAKDDINHNLPGQGGLTHFECKFHTKGLLSVREFKLACLGLE